LLHLVFILLLAAHLVAVNIATAAPLVCLWLKRREVRGGDAEAGRVGLFLAWQSVTMLLVGIVLGSLAAWLLWLQGDHRFFDALSVVPRRRLWFGVVELLFFLALMVWYAWAWPRVRRPTLWHPALAILAATDLIYHFPPLFAGIAVLEGKSALPPEELSYSGFLALMYAPETLARVLHFLLASAAVTAAWMLVYQLRQDRADREPFSQRWIAWAARLALAPSLAQLLAGVYLLLVLPATQQQRLMGGDWLATGLFATSIFAVFGLLHSLASLSLGETSRREMYRSLALMVLVVLAMTAARGT
jgi:hypothetical protein